MRLSTFAKKYLLNLSLMRFFYYCVFVFSICIHSANSQTFLGVKGGLNYVNNVTDFESREIFFGFQDNETEYRLSYHFGGFATFSVSDVFKVRSELLLTSKGSKSSFPDFDLNLKLLYINVPVLFQFLVHENVGVEIGPELGYLVSARVKRPGSDGTDVRDLYEYEKVDLGVIFGGRYFVFNAFSIGLHYSHGISATNENAYFDEDALFIGEADFKNRSFQLSVSYRLN